MANEKRLIDAYKLENLVRSNSARYHHVDDVIAAIAGQPTVDAVEVVYCKDCKSHHWEQEPFHGKTVHICSKLNAEITRDFYCGAGERKDNERTD